MQTNIQKQVMRRVYYSYGLSIVTHNMFWQGLLLGGSVAAFGRLTHVAALVKNFLAIPVGHIPGYISQAFVHAAESGEMMTVVVSMLMVALTVSFGYQISRQMPITAVRAV